MKITLSQLEKLLSFDVLKYDACIEINFAIENDLKYQNCWLGKTISLNKKGISYWYGLMDDSSEAYCYSSIDEFINAPVFYGKSLKESINITIIYAIDGCDPKERILDYLNDVPSFIRSAAR